MKHFYVTEFFTSDSITIDIITNEGHIISHAELSVISNTLLSFKTNETYQNQGYGIKLLKYIIKLCKTLNIKKIILDDCSDRFNHNNNIYLKCGFKYLIKNHPEMVLHIH
jgi:GNAT superfamily N-acetyltransferase